MPEPHEENAYNAIVAMSLVMRRLMGAATLVAIGTILIACPQRTEVWVSPTATASHLTLVLGSQRGEQSKAAIGAIVVSNCGTGKTYETEKAVWVVRSSGRPPMIDQVIYGIAPAGMLSESGPTPLSPGCYTVQVSGTGRTQFRIKADGSVADEGRPW